ncbi:hypothetical protein EHI8A_077690 [Entamoeba histolytica HM-1:IMSS-B]|uniref:Rab-GAP TBC domain-containing protein n=6 Tax=Entamoeba histolytica TaxID=5759 RepID=B1N2T7_ENTH1|nr:hypothetical protein EHI_069150 [Entamoeba histolytica HM-1:IMSS]EMD43234.1 Hypothetical protein EHI5A_118160 [Entamoeba histolytica KU27]EMH77685.1 hypothetical protein EHI8A_077690 [Entamoeba histolytica HM-1:IMSS-B]EMS14517.1 hypothetical protein KM1_136900 [Entamoeba histolytica HM-3:IMSS]ENY65729.1 hypothetical protein EHI7A_074910 [Entamoeba histolytica HM-1:IMSS-A]GAT93093.1 hypothetical protein CL6EHI_069150 [Entamoeba histolytica]|eukprot:XP_001913503.1 hypothetical protein EHI_069150 [Entamoeba histolytica HM-1:IMSS]
MSLTTYDNDFNLDELNDISEFNIGSPESTKPNISNEFLDIGSDWDTAFEEEEEKKEEEKEKPKDIKQLKTLKNVEIDYHEESISSVFKNKIGNFFELRKSVLVEGFKEEEKELREKVWAILLKRKPLNTDEYIQYCNLSRLNQTIIELTQNKIVQKISNAIVNWFDKRNQQWYNINTIIHLINVFLSVTNELNTFYCCIAFLSKQSIHYSNKKAWKYALISILSIVDMDLCLHIVQYIDVIEPWLQSYCLTLYSLDDSLKLMDYLIATHPSFCLYVISALIVSYHSELLQSTSIESDLKSLKPISINKILHFSNMLYTQSYVSVRNYIDLL